MLSKLSLRKCEYLLFSFSFLDSFPILAIEEVNEFLSYGGYLFRAIADTLAHDKAIIVFKVLAFFQLLINRVELVNDANVLELLSLLIVCLATKYQDSIMIPRQVYCNNV
jgi:hypothetical protein